PAEPAEPAKPAAPEPAAPGPAVPGPAVPTVAELGLDDLGDGVDVIVNEKSISFRISNELLFPSGQAMLSPNGLGLIQRMAGVINRSQGYPVSVEGHSDPVPIQTRQFPSNWELSTSRATSVLRGLVRDGVAPARLRAVGYADTRPIASNDTPGGRAANRRVELIMEITPGREAVAGGQADPKRGVQAVPGDAHQG
ncbi:MAG TPA: OmpA family protein, partial [Bordetella sp.]|nr:OmpA family protein [Bordetella sp.]